MSAQEERDTRAVSSLHDAADGDHDHDPSTPSSQPDEKNGVGLKAGKDRYCPFCSQAFTSSSLGRHLDLYIKPKNPKPPDGVHDIAEIKRLRAGITRRQPRTSGRHEGVDNLEPTWHRNARETSTPAAHDNTNAQSTAAPTPTPNAYKHSPIGSPRATAKATGSPNSAGVNMTSWQATGVINDLPPRSSNKDRERVDNSVATQAQRMQDMRRNQAGQRVERPEYETEGMRKLEEQAEVGKAAELALRELLGSIKAAQKKVEPKELFPGIDFMSLSFPALCLAILPSPPTIFGPNPFPSLESWSLDPPGRKQVDNLRRMFNDQVLKKQKDGFPNFPDSIAFHHSAHLNNAYEHWSAMSDQERYSTWILELCRSVAKGREENTRLEKQLDLVENRVRHLEAEYDRLAGCQLPREYLLRAPQTLPVTSTIARDIESSGKPTEASSADFDIDALIGSWRAKVRATARKPTQFSSYRTDYGAQARDIYNPRLQDDMIVNGSIFGVNGPFQRSEQDPVKSGVEYANRSPVVAIEEVQSTPDSRSGTTPHATHSSMADADLKELSRTGTLARLARAEAEPSQNVNANGKRPLKGDTR